MSERYLRKELGLHVYSRGTRYCNSGTKRVYLMRVRDFSLLGHGSGEFN